MLLALFVLTSCQRDDPFVPAAELPFETHPSVLRGNWSGTIFNIPESKNSTLELSDLSAECADEPEFDTDETTCERYTFAGTISVDGGEAVPVIGEGDVGDYLYTLTSPARPAPPALSGAFELDGQLWDFYANYQDSSPDLTGEPLYEGSIGADNVYIRSSGFSLEPTNP